MATPKTQAKWIHDVHPSVRMIESIIAGMKQETGRSVEEWIKFVEKTGPWTWTRPTIRRAGIRKGDSSTGIT